jgi:hypothetical protein
VGEGQSGIAIHDRAMSGAYPNCTRYVPDTRERASVLGALDFRRRRLSKDHSDGPVAPATHQGEDAD